MKNKKLYRSCDSRILGGVAGGMGEYFEIDPVLIRLIWLLMIVFGGVGLALYIIAWVIVPNDPACAKTKATDEMKEKADSIAREAKSALNSKNKPEKSLILVIGGFFLIALGTMLIFENLIGINLFANLWPALLIIIGLAIIYRSTDK